MATNTAMIIAMATGTQMTMSSGGPVRGDDAGSAATARRGAAMANGGAAELLLMQITDSTFPIGAYAHSYGLETYVQRGIVHDDATAERYVAAQLAGPLPYLELLGMRLAYERAHVDAGGALAGRSEGACEREAAPGHQLAGRIDQLAALDERVLAFKGPAELRSASERLGARFCRLAGTLLEGPAAEAFARYADSPGAHAVSVAYGAFAAAAGIPLAPLMRRYLYSQVSAMVTTLVKAVPLRQTSGQRILRQSFSAQDVALDRACRARADDLGRSAPGFDIRSIEHESLYSRLYMS